MKRKYSASTPSLDDRACSSSTGRLSENRHFFSNQGISKKISTVIYVISRCLAHSLTGALFFRNNAELGKKGILGQAPSTHRRPACPNLGHYLNIYRSWLSEHFRLTRIFTIKHLITVIFLLLSLLVPAQRGQAQGLQTGEEVILGQAAVFFSQASKSDNPALAAELYGKALLRYETLAKEIDNGKLYYNIGNVYFRLDDLGRAIVNYRRAERLSPDDPNLRQNLGYALSKRQDRIESKVEQELVRTLFFWHYDLPTALRAKIFAGCYILFWLLVTLRFATPISLDKRRKKHCWPLVLFFILSLSLGGSLFLERFENDLPKGVLVIPEVIARKGDSVSYQPSFQAPLHAGTEFTILEERPAWLRIELQDGRQCWVEKQSAEHI